MTESIVIMWAEFIADPGLPLRYFGIGCLFMALVCFVIAVATSLLDRKEDNIGSISEINTNRTD